MGRVITKAAHEERWKVVRELVDLYVQDAVEAHEESKHCEYSPRAEGYYDGFATALRFVQSRLKEYDFPGERDEPPKGPMC